jgi:hypothetical protein
VTHCLRMLGLGVAPTVTALVLDAPLPSQR